ncbi:MAG: glycosyltransferase family 4 protein, partial [Gammaproteobacteria bacterium]|nr:glycosyltransferase family 4 protein [Gammaproteobacteria bacterium]
AIAIDKATLTLVQASLPAVSVSLLPNCINSSTPTHSHQNPALQPTVLFIGWVLAEKGLDELISAWELLQPPGWLLKLIGPGGENYQRTHLHRLRSGNLEVCGALPHPQVMSQLDACEILVLPSHTEGFPNVILEAMSRGKPVVATSVGAIPEMLCDDCGVLVKPQDVASLAAGLEMLIHQPELRLAMGEKARQRVETNYSCTTVFPRLLRIWEEAGSENV